jgi:coproporphyrinogen III oxidase
LVSLPNLVSWHYRPEWAENSAESNLTSYFLKPRDWLKLNKN